MIDYYREKGENAKALKKLMVKWLAMQETQRKAALLLARNPEIKIPKAIRNRKAS
jgi:hypothetical protein